MGNAMPIGGIPIPLGAGMGMRMDGQNSANESTSQGNNTNTKKDNNKNTIGNTNCYECNSEKHYKQPNHYQPPHFQHQYDPHDHHSHPHHHHPPPPRHHGHSPPPPHHHHNGHGPPPPPHHHHHGPPPRHNHHNGHHPPPPHHNHCPPPHHRHSPPPHNHQNHHHFHEFHPPPHDNHRDKHHIERGRRCRDTDRSILLHKGCKMLENKYLTPISTGRELSKEEKVRLRDIGCIVIKNGVKKELIQRALRKINYTLSVDAKRLYDIEFAKSAEFINLFTQSDALSILESILGKNNVKVKDDSCDIALIYPEHPDYIPCDDKEWKIDEENWSIDGMQHRECKLPQYNVLCVIALSKQQLPFNGQFVYWPQTHVEVQKMVKQYGYNKWRNMNLRAISRQKWDMKGVQCDVDIGDIIIAHPFLCHKKGINFSMNISYNIYYRIQHKHFYEMDKERIHNLWIGYEGLRDLDN